VFVFLKSVFKNVDTDLNAKGHRLSPSGLENSVITKSQAGPLIVAMIIMPPFERMSMRLRIT
jgi:hypothetical protein